MPPKQKPHRSTQEVETPPELIAAVEHRFGKIDFDLAASKSNAKAKRYFTKTDNALDRNWAELPRVQVAWLNPEFGTIKPWAKLCHAVGELRRFTLLLVPLGVQDWACEFVWRQSYVLKLQGRVMFVGHDQPYPKDLSLVVYGYGLVGEEVWDWRREVAGECPF